jgi:uncharacterized protein
MSERPTSYLSPKLKSRKKKNGHGVFAQQNLSEGELLVVFGGAVCDLETLMTMPKRDQSLSIQVEENLFLVPRPLGDADYVNHCCDPNAGIVGQTVLVALREIQAGEEVCFDYAMSDTTPYDEFECDCGAPNCRGKITGNDWQLEELQQRYAGYFSSHVQRRIDAQQLIGNDNPMHGKAY